MSLRRCSIVLAVVSAVGGLGGCASGGGTGRDAGRESGGIDASAPPDVSPGIDGGGVGETDAPGLDAPAVDAPAVDAPLVDAPLVDAPLGVDAAERCRGVDCSGLATACLDAACDPSTGVCRTTPRGDGIPCGVATACSEPRCSAGACVSAPRTGAVCDDGDACTTTDRCTSTGSCAGSPAASCGDGACNCGETAASCAGDCGGPTGIPSNACATGTGSRDRCSGARIVGRSAASAAGGWSSGVQNTCSASDRHDDACPSFDVGNDHTYAIFVRAGERVTAEIGTTSTRCATGEEFNSYLKLKFNPDASAAGAAACPTFVACYGGPGRGDAYTTLRTYDATADGWLFVIVDGGATAFDEHRGYYTLRVELTRCASAGCGC